MRWVFLGAVDVPTHAKSGITERQTRSLWSDRRLLALLTALDGDKWRTLPAECTHISNSITLSQHRNSHCQSGSAIYSNRRKSAHICVVTLLFALFFALRFPTWLHSWTITFAVCLIHLAYTYYDISPTKKITVMEDQPYPLQPQCSSNRRPDFENYDIRGINIFHFSNISVSFPVCFDYVITQ